MNKMVVETGKQPIEQIKKLEQFLPERSKEEIAQILAYGERIKAEGEKKKKEFWKNHNTDDFMKLLKYKRSHFETLVKKYKYLEGMSRRNCQKFVDEYLQYDILYSGEIGEDSDKESKRYYYQDWENGLIEWDKYSVCLHFQNQRTSRHYEGLQDVVQMELKEGMTLDLSSNAFGDEGAEIIAKNMELKEGVYLKLGDNNIGEKGIKSIVENMKLKEGVYLGLSSNNMGEKGAELISKMDFKNGVNLNLDNNGIGDKGAEFIAKNMELKDGMTLNLSYNKIGDEGAAALSKIKLKEGVRLLLDANEIGDGGIKAIIENMELKNGTSLYLRNTKMSISMWDKLKEWEKSYHDRGINCKVEYL